MYFSEDYVLQCDEYQGIRRFPDMHLQSPIRKSKYLSDVNNFKETLLSKLQHRSPLIRHKAIKDDPYPTIFSLVHSICCGEHLFMHGDELDMSHLPAASLYLRLILSTDLFSINGWDYNCIHKVITENDDLRSLCVARYNLIKLCTTMARVIQRGSMNRESPQFHKLIKYNRTNANNDIWIAGNMCVMNTRHGLLLLNHELTLMISDLISQRFIVFLISKLNEAYLKLHWIPPSELIHTCIEYFDKILIKKGTKAYCIIKYWEPLCVGRLLSLSPSEIVDCWAFHNETKDNLLKDISDMFRGEDNKKTIDLVTSQINYLNQITNKHFLSELYGLYRIWAHPLVDAQEGGDAIRKIAARKKFISPHHAKLIEWKVKELITIGYFKQHHQYPNVAFNESADQQSYVKECISNSIPIDTKHVLYDLSLWETVEGCETFEIPAIVDINLMVADKALSPSKSQLIENIIQGRGIGTPEQRRVVLQWLKNHFPKPYEFLKRINLEGIQKDQQIIGTCPKEREVRVVPRMFSVMSLDIRTYIVLTEDMIARDILPLFSEITMVDSLLELTSKMIKTTQHSTVYNKPSRGKPTYDVFFSLDFSKWNSNMRDELVKGPFQFIDNLYGFNNVLARTHEIFSQSIIYIADPACLPQIKDSEIVIDNKRAWTNHLGGFEGLRQKGWTVITVAGIRYIADKLNVEISLLGQGDNQMLRVKFPLILGSEEAIINDLRFKVLQFKNTISEFFSLIGLPLKIDETWASEHLFIYGKFLIYDGMPLSTLLKKLSTCRPYSSQSIPTLDNAISTVSANCTAANLYSYEPIIPLIVAAIEESYCFKTHLTNSLICSDRVLHQLWKVKNIMNSFIDIKYLHAQSNLNKLIVLLMIYGGVLGGYPVLNPLHLLIRGFPDPLSEWLCIYKLLLENNPPDWIKRGVLNIINVELTKHPDLDGLIEEPLSLPVAENKRPESVLKGICKRYLKNATWVKNNYFRTFIKLGDDQRTRLIKTLVEMTPFDPRLAHEILHASVWGYTNSVLGRIQNTSTLQVLAIKSSERSPLAIIQKSEKTCLDSTIFRLLRTDLKIKHTTITCSRVLAQILRDNGWNLKRVIGVTVPHPCEFLKQHGPVIETCIKCQSGDNNYILSIGSEVLSEFGSLSLSLPGPFYPYLGSETKEKIQPGVEKLKVSPNPLIKKAIDIQRVIGWFVSPNSLLAQIIQSLITSISDIDPNLFITQRATCTGCEDHRFQDAITSHGGFISSMYNYYTHTYTCTSTMSKFRKGSENVNLHFQAIICYCQYMTVNHTLKHQLMNIPHRLVFHFHQHCPECVCSVNTEESVLTSDKCQVSLISYKHIPLIWIPKEDLAISKIGPLGSDISLLDYEEIEKLNANLINHMIAQVVADKAIMHIQKFDTGWGMKEILPITWAEQVNPVILLLRLSKLLICGLSYLILGRTGWGACNSLQDLIESIRVKIESCNPECLHYLSSMLDVKYTIKTLKDHFPGVAMPRFCNRDISSAESYLIRIVRFLSYQDLTILENKLEGIVIPSRRRCTSTLWETMFDASLKVDKELSLIYLKGYKQLIVSLPLEYDRLILSPHKFMERIQSQYAKEEKPLYVKHLQEILSSQTFKLVNQSIDYVVKSIPSKPFTIKPKIGEPLLSKILNVISSFVADIGGIYYSLCSDSLSLTQKDLPEPFQRIKTRDLEDIPHFGFMDTSRIYGWVSVFTEFKHLMTLPVIILGDGLGYLSFFLSSVLKNKHVFPLDYVPDNLIGPESFVNQQVSILEEENIEEDLNAELNNIRVLNHSIGFGLSYSISKILNRYPNAIVLSDITVNIIEVSTTFWTNYAKIVGIALSMRKSLCILKLSRLPETVLKYMIDELNNYGLTIHIFIPYIGSRSRNDIFYIITNPWSLDTVACREYSRNKVVSGSNLSLIHSPVVRILDNMFHSKCQPIRNYGLEITKMCVQQIDQLTFMIANFLESTSLKWYNVLIRNLEMKVSPKSITRIWMDWLRSKYQPVSFSFLTSSHVSKFQSKTARLMMGLIFSYLSLLIMTKDVPQETIIALIREPDNLMFVKVKRGKWVIMRKLVEQNLFNPKENLNVKHVIKGREKSVLTEMVSLFKFQVTDHIFENESELIQLCGVHLLK